MKTCPYCAEEIKDAAIVCRYCGRDLLKEGKEIRTEVTPPGVTKKNQVSAGVQGVKISAIFTALALISIIIRYINSPIDMLGSILFGLPVTFLLWWLIATGFIALWRKGIGAFFGVLGGVVILIVSFIMLLGTSVFSTPIPTPTYKPPLTPTKTRIPPTPTKTKIPTPTPRIFSSLPVISCYNWEQVNSSFEGKNICVTGVIANFIVNTSSYGNVTATNCKTYFSNKPNTFYLIGCFERPLPEIGDCVTVRGVVELNIYKTPYIILYKNYTYCN